MTCMIMAKIFESNTVGENQDAINMAISRVGTNGIVHLPCGVFNLGVFVFQSGYVELRGCAQSALVSSRDALAGGTVLLGGIDMNIQDVITVRSLGVDVLNSPPGGAGLGFDAIRSGGQRRDVPQYARIINVTTLIPFGNNTGHGAVFTSGGGNKLRSTVHYGGAHGFAFRGSNNIATNVFVDSPSSSIATIKSIDAAGDAENNRIIDLFGINGKIALESHGNTINQNNYVRATVQNPTDGDGDGIRYATLPTAVSGGIVGTLGQNDVQVATI